MSNFEKRYEDILSLLTDARRNPDKNPRVSVLDKIYEYQNDPDMYLHFSFHDYVGIYPSSHWNYEDRDMQGIYCYPCDMIVDTYLSGDINEDKRNKKHISENWLFVESPYANFIKYNGKGKYVRDIRTDETPEEWKSDNKIKLKAFLEKLFSNPEVIKKIDMKVINNLMGLAEMDCLVYEDFFLIDYIINNYIDYIDFVEDTGYKKNYFSYYKMKDHEFDDDYKILVNNINTLKKMDIDSSVKMNILSLFSHAEMLIFSDYDQINDNGINFPKLPKIEEILRKDVCFFNKEAFIKTVMNSFDGSFKSFDVIMDYFSEGGFDLLGKSEALWITKLLLVCGYALVVDRTGGYISSIPEERIQGVFLDSSAFDVIMTMNNDLAPDDIKKERR